jgi:hypothetical protein
MIPPGLRTAASPARPPGLIFRDRLGGIRLTGKPAGVHALHMLGDGPRFLRWRAGIRLGLLVRQLTRMHHHKPERLRDDSSVAVLDLDLPDDALTMPTAGLLVLRPPGLLYQEREGGLLLPPRFELLAYGTGARDQGH